MSDLESNLSRSLKVECNGAFGLPIYDFLLVSNSNYMSNSHCLAVIATQKVFSYFLSLGPNFDPPTPTLPRADFFSRLNGFLPGSEGKLPPKMKMKLIGSIFF